MPVPVPPPDVAAGNCCHRYDLDLGEELDFLDVLLNAPGNPVHALSACVGGAPRRRAAWDDPIKISPAAHLEALKHEREDGRKWRVRWLGAGPCVGWFPYSLLR